MFKQLHFKTMLLLGLMLAGVSSAWAEETKTGSYTFTTTGCSGWTTDNAGSYCGGYGRNKNGSYYVVNADIENFKNVDFSTVINPSVTITVKALVNGGTNEYTVSLVDKDGNVVGTPVTKTDGMGSGSNASSAKESSVELTPIKGTTGYRIDFLAKSAITATSYKLTYTVETRTLDHIGLSGDYKTAFYVGDEFDFGGIVTAYYTDETNSDVTTNATFSGYDMSTAGSQTVTVTFNGKTATYGITVSELPKFTVTFSDGGSLTEATASAGVTLPTHANIGEYTFVGWAESSVATGTESVVTTAAGETYKPTENTTLYPVYSYNVYGPAIEWQEISDAPENGEYVIAAATYAMKATISSNRFANATVEIISGTPAILKDEPTSDYIWEIAKDGSAYTIKNGSNYAGTTSTEKQGALLSGDDAATDYAKWTITYDDGFVIENKGRSGDYTTLRNNTTYGWAVYKSTTGNAPRLFKKTNVTKATPRYTSAPTATVSINVACTDGEGMYYGTFSSNCAFVVPSNLIVSEIGIVDEKLYIESYNTGDVVPANTGVIVSCDEANDFVVNLTAEEGNSILDTDNCLRASGDAGTLAAAMTAADADCKFYRLTMHNGETIGFWWGAAEGAAFDIAANKAYLAVPNTAGARAGFALFGDNVTAIESVKSVADGEAVVYNLQGQRVNANVKGIVIKNGKKFINK